MLRNLSIAGFGLMLISLHAAAQPAPPPMTQSAGPEDQQRVGQDPQADINCRRSAASRTGYGTGASSAVQHRYAAAYYACMDRENGAPAPDNYAYSSPPPAYYDYGRYPYPYSYTHSYYDYGPYPYPYSYAYPYYYPPYYYGPAVTFGFGFGGGRGGFRGGFHGGGRR
jgi:hypothetical protein